MTAAAVQQRLDSWKEIAAHLGRRVRTVQRWEREEGLPVRRHAHRRRGTVYALVDELDAWHLGRQLAPGTVGSNPTSEVAPEVARALVAATDAAEASGAAPLASRVTPSDAGGASARPRYRKRSLTLLGAAILVAACGVVAVRFHRSNSESVAGDPDWALTARYLLERGSRSGIERARDLCSRQLLGPLPAPAAAAAHECVAETTLALVRLRELPRAAGLRAAIAEAERAVALDARRARASTVAARAQFALDWNAAAAESRLRRVIAMAPDTAHAHHALAQLLSLQGRHDEAIAELRHAQRTAPLSAAVNDDGCWYFYRARRPREALVEAERALLLEPDRPGALECIVDARAALGEHEAARAAAVALLRAQGDAAADLVAAAPATRSAAIAAPAAARTIRRDAKRRLRGAAGSVRLHAGSTGSPRRSLPLARALCRGTRSGSAARASASRLRQPAWRPAVGAAAEASRCVGDAAVCSIRACASGQDPWARAVVSRGDGSVSYETWRARVGAELRSEAEPQRGAAAVEELAVEPLYAAHHLAAETLLPRPLTSGGSWRIWQELPLSAGVTGGVALARETERELGGVWLRVDDDTATVDGVAALLRDVLRASDIELAIEWAGEPLAASAVLVAAAQATGVEPGHLRGCLGCDPLGALARRGTLSAGACEQLVGAARWTATNAPGMRAGLVSTAPYADAGADAVQEIAFALATGAEALRWLLDAGFAPAEAAGQLFVSATSGRDLYLQLAKLRALRLTWGMLLAGVDAPPSTMRLHARTSWRTKSALDPGTDLVRATLETFAAVLAGCDDITTTPFLDEQLELALGIPLGSATQLLLREEVGLDRVADVAGGSWYVESLTAMLARRAWEMFEGIERRGGMARELAVGAVAQRVAEAAERRRGAVEEKRLPIVGVTVQAAKQPVPLPHRPLAVPVAPSDGGVRAVAALRATAHTAGTPRDGAASSTSDPSAHSQISLRGAVDSPELFESVVAASRRGASLSALAAALPSDGPSLRAPALRRWRDAEPFERPTDGAHASRSESGDPATQPQPVPEGATR